MSTAGPRVVFVPASGPTGSGEYYRAVNLARALHRHRPGIETHVLLSRAARVPVDPQLTVHRLPDTPARAGRDVEALIAELRPELAVFDGSGRVRQLRAVRRFGGRVTWISNRPGRRRRAFSPRRLRYIDLHVLIETGDPSPVLGRLERVLARAWPRTSHRFASAVAPVPGPLPPDLEALAATEPAVFVSGGGGQHIEGRPVPDLFVEAAGRFRRETGVPACVVLGPQYRGTPPAVEDVELVPALTTEALGGLLARARVVVAGGGNMLSNQVVLARRPAVLVATGGHDQPARIERYARAGAIRPALLDAGSIAEAAIGLVREKDAAEALMTGLDRLGIRDDTDRIAEWLLAESTR